MKNLRFAHISDLHFGSFALSPFQFFSKRWLGNFNFLFKRKREFAYDRLIELVHLFKNQGVTHVIITGDLSVTSRLIEFSMCHKFIDLLKKEGFTVFTVPGNHDQYTRRSYKKKEFYHFFDSKFDQNCPFNLKEHKVTYTQIEDHLWLIALDTAIATSLTSSQGYFSPETEENLEKILTTIPPEDKIILFNHFPFFQNDVVSKQLVRGPLLKSLLMKHPNVLFYLHGHTHRQIVADLRSNQLPIISDTGSTPHLKEGACHLFSLDHNEVKLDVYRYENSWQEKETHRFKIS